MLGAPLALSQKPLALCAIQGRPAAAGDHQLKCRSPSAKQTCNEDSARAPLLASSWPLALRKSSKAQRGIDGAGPPAPMPPAVAVLCMFVIPTPL